jgi:16S rRNA (guanine(527)-N(7))-methyltransferase RsmG
MTVERQFNAAQQEIFAALVMKNKLDARQAEQIQKYVWLLLEWQEKVNLTALETVEEILKLHFQDSLALAHAADMDSFSHVADIGTGAGFPGLPLKIMFPHLKVTLIEVNQKKQHFLRLVTEQLALANVTVCELDWRTFLRKTDWTIDLFVSRAALGPDELIRVFKPSSPYYQSTLVYWASSQWKPSDAEADLIDKEVSYKIDHRIRRLVFFKKSAEMKKGQRNVTSINH